MLITLGLDPEDAQTLTLNSDKASAPIATPAEAGLSYSLSVCLRTIATTGMRGFEQLKTAFLILFLSSQLALHPCQLPFQLLHLSTLLIALESQLS